MPPPGTAAAAEGRAATPPPASAAIAMRSSTASSRALSSRALWMTSIAAPTTTIARPVTPPEMRKGNWAIETLLLAAPFQPRKIPAKPSRHSRIPSWPPRRPKLFIVVLPTEG